ncbi:calcium-binding protein 39-like, partial [Sigmodon hispidus]
VWLDERMSYLGRIELTRAVPPSLMVIDFQSDHSNRQMEEVSKSLQAMKEILCGTNDKEPPTGVVAQLAQELYSSGLLVTLIADLQLIDFEEKKDREENYDTIFEDYEKLLQSENYVTKRQSLKLLGELILDRHNFAIMTKYISKPENLKLMMNLLRDKSPNIQFEAFHVFKVFVASPHKTQPIVEILLKNQPKLIEFLSSFQKERTDDEQFADEKNYLIKQIRDLKKTSP